MEERKKPLQRDKDIEKMTNSKDRPKVQRENNDRDRKKVYEEKNENGKKRKTEMYIRKRNRKL